MKKAILLFLCLLMLLMCSCGLKETTPAVQPVKPNAQPDSGAANPDPEKNSGSITPDPGKDTGDMHNYNDAVKGEELMCLVDSEEEAKAVAEQYGIELVDCSYGVATFHTDRDPSEVIKEGLKNGWKELSVNGYKELYN